VGHVDLGERDRILRLLTADLGRVSAVARGARGSRKRFAGAMDSGALIAASLRPGRGELWVLDVATLLEGRSGARQDLHRLSLLAYAVELCSSLARQEHPEPKLFGLLEMAALLIDAMTGPPGSAFRAGLEAKALTFAGLTPSLRACVACGEEAGSVDGAGEVSFAPLRGGVLHSTCGPEGIRVSETWCAAVEDARRTPLRALVDRDLPPGPSWALSAMVEAHLRRGLKSKTLLRSLEESLAPT